MSNSHLIAFTTDPYDNIYGYTLVFFRFLNYLQLNYSLPISLYSNDGVCSSLVINQNFYSVSLKRKSSLIQKTLKTFLYFYHHARASSPETIFLVNCEIPELIVGALLSHQHRPVFALFQDDRVRNKKLITRFICALRLFLLRRHHYVLFTNKHTFNRVKGNFQSFYLGNPVFFS